MRRWLVSTVFLCAALGSASARENPLVPAGRAGVPATLDAEAARGTATRCLDWLLANQRQSGAWAHAVVGDSWEAGFAVETHYCWQIAASSLANMALLAAPPTEARTAALEKGLRWLATTRMPKRGNDWDTDFMWAALYGSVALTEAYDHPRLAESAALRRDLAARARRFIAILEANQAPLGGWAYYDDPPTTRRNKWATSFCTALILPTLARARDLGWLADERTIDRAIRYVEKSRLPNGAYQYSVDMTPWVGGDSINQVKGSLSRIQVCEWALHIMGRRTDADVRRGLEPFFADHKFLDAARLKPIPHESFYYNAGYFYCFGHYYAALAIERLPLAEREAWHARLRPHLVKTIRRDGSTSDFLRGSYMVVASTSYSILALLHGLPETRAVAE